MQIRKIVLLFNGNKFKKQPSGELVMSGQQNISILNCTTAQEAVVLFVIPPPQYELLSTGDVAPETSLEVPCSFD